MEALASAYFAKTFTLPEMMSFFTALTLATMSCFSAISTSKVPTAFSEMSAALGGVSAAGASVWKPAQVGLCPGCGSEDGLGFDTRAHARYSPRGLVCHRATHPAAYSER